MEEKGKLSMNEIRPQLQKFGYDGRRIWKEN